MVFSELPFEIQYNPIITEANIKWYSMKSSTIAKIDLRSEIELMDDAD